MVHVERGATAVGDETVLGVTEFKSRCLGLIDDVAQGRVGRVVLRRRNRAVAALVPLSDETQDLWGALRGSVLVSPGTDLTGPTGEAWEADA
jgi:antitoxin (DNA-binding transcriptional repressor) of toxin-antitoxin stability system